MYSLYKQATVGNVRSPRPGIWDMLGRAKWDAWAQHKDLNPQEAKWLYVDALMKVLRKYSDKTVARDLVQELESYNEEASNLVLSRTISGSSSTSSGSTVSEDGGLRRMTPAQPLLPGRRTSQSNTPQKQDPALESSSEEESEAEEPTELRQARTPSERSYSQLLRPQSSLSGRHYRTPMAGSSIMSPPPPHIPASQPMPILTSSAFAGDTNMTGSVPTSYYRPPSTSLNPVMDPRRVMSPQHTHYPTQPLIPPYPQEPQSTLERALESVQAHVAALTERLEVLEARTPARRSTSSLSQSNSPAHQDRNGYFPHGHRYWGTENWGLWSLVLNPVSRCLEVIHQLTTFFMNTNMESPALTIVRRLALDVSFLVCVLTIFKLLWRKSGLRRREVLAALVALWRAIAGTNRDRRLVDKGV